MDRGTFGLIDSEIEIRIGIELFGSIPYDQQMTLFSLALSKAFSIISITVIP